MTLSGTDWIRLIDAAEAGCSGGGVNVAAMAVLSLQMQSMRGNQDYDGLLGNALAVRDHVRNIFPHGEQCPSSTS